MVRGARRNLALQSDIELIDLSRRHLLHRTLTEHRPNVGVEQLLVALQRALTDLFLLPPWRAKPDPLIDPLCDRDLAGIDMLPCIDLPDVLPAKWAGRATFARMSGAISTNNNVDLYVQGNDTSMQITIDGVDFENLKSSVLPHIYVDGGLRGFVMQNSECLNNDTYVAQGCIWFNSAAAPIGNVKIDKVEVRATTNNNSYTAFKATGANTLTDTFRIGDIYWQTFDLSGQTRFSGFNFQQIVGQLRLFVSSTNVIGITSVGYGQSLPIKLAATGEWVNVQATNITQSVAAGTPSTTYNIYAYNSAATNAPYTIALEASATAFTIDASGGYNVKTGDATRTFVGTITTDGSGNFTP